VQAIVYVIDAADADSLDSAARELAALIEKPSLSSIPLLVLGNKNDLPEALTTQELIDRLGLKVSSRLFTGTLPITAPSPVTASTRHLAPTCY
jgi:ADP-ribosylation factor-like protein 8